MQAPGEMHPSDGEVRDRILREFGRDGAFAASDIGVAVEDGVVTLHGTIDTYAKKWHAEEAALRAAGVKAVANELRVELAPKLVRSDDHIAHAAAVALETEADVGDGVKTTVDQGWITLHGTVTYRFEREAAERAVRHIEGLRGIINEIDLKPATPEDVRRLVVSALVKIAENDARNIEVSIVDGRAVLKGHVHSLFEKEEAKRVASLAAGVHEVVDDLSLAP